MYGREKGGKNQGIERKYQTRKDGTDVGMHKGREKGWMEGGLESKNDGRD